MAVGLSIPMDVNGEDRGEGVDVTTLPNVLSPAFFVVDCGVRRTLTFFFRLDCIDRCGLSTLPRSGVPNFLAEFDFFRCYSGRERNKPKGDL